MNTSYPFEEHTTVGLAPAIANLSAPTLVELAVAVDITCELVRDGLDLTKTTDSIVRPRWTQDLEYEFPGRYKFQSPTLKARRQLPGNAERLYSRAILRTRTFLIVRRGVPYGTPWLTGQTVEAYNALFGQRTNAPSASNTTATFSVQLFITDDVDNAVIA